MNEKKLKKMGLKIVGPIPDDLHEEVSRRMNNPKIPQHPNLVTCEEGLNTAYFDFATGETGIFEEFISFLVEKGIERDRAIVGTSMHEFGHYTDFPITSWMSETIRWRLEALRLNSYKQKLWEKIQKDYDFKKDINDLKPHEVKVLDNLAKNRVNTVFGYYIDLIDNLNLMCHKYNSELRDMYKVLHEPGKGECIDNFMVEAYDLFSAHSLNLKDKIFDEERIKELEKIYLGLGADYRQRQLDVLVFADIIDPLLKDEFKKGKGGGDGGIEIPGLGRDGEGEDKKGKGDQPDLDDLDPEPEGFGDIHENNMDEKQKAKTLEDIAHNCGRGRYKVMKDFISPDKLDYVVQAPKEIFGIGGADEGETVIPDVSKIIIDFYQNRARKYPTFEFNIPLYTNKEDEFQLGFKEWGGDPTKLDPIESRGLIIPDYSQEHRIVPRKKKSKGFDTPNAIILVDSSGSEPDPSNTNPCALNALAAGVVAENYLRNGRKVGVLNFSGSSFILLPTDNRYNIYYASIMYQGGGTVVNTQKLYDLVKEMDKITADELSAMTDAEIARRFSPEIVEKAKEKKVAVPSADLSVYENTDIWIFSDLDIMNLQEMYDLASLDKKRRVFFVQSRGDFGELDIPEGCYNNVFYSTLLKEHDLYNVIDMLKIGFGRKDAQSRASGLSHFRRKND